MIEIINLVKEFKNTIAVDNISFKVEPGKVFGLLGPNGAGKTTTIRMILNIIKPSSGRILYNSKEINNDFQNLIGYLPEERGLYRRSKVMDLIIYFAGLKGVNRSQAIISAKKWLKRLEISHFSENKIEELSKGTQQKVQFITAIIHDPQILILDEPFSGLDPLIQFTVKKIIRQFLSEGKILILSTHMMEYAEQLCSEIFLLNKGKEVLSGSLLEVKNKFAKNIFKMEFTGDPIYLRNLPGIQSISIEKNIAEFKIEDYYSPEEILRNAVNVVNVKSFTKVEPSLYNIFMKILSGNSLFENFYEKNITNSAV